MRKRQPLSDGKVTNSTPLTGINKQHKHLPRARTNWEEMAHRMASAFLFLLVKCTKVAPPQTNWLLKSTSYSFYLSLKGKRNKKKNGKKLTCEFTSMTIQSFSLPWATCISIWSKLFQPLAVWGRIHTAEFIVAQDLVLSIQTNHIKSLWGTWWSWKF